MYILANKANQDKTKLYHTFTEFLHSDIHLRNCIIMDLYQTISMLPLKSYIYNRQTRMFMHHGMSQSIEFRNGPGLVSHGNRTRYQNIVELRCKSWNILIELLNCHLLAPHQFISTYSSVELPLIGTTLVHQHIFFSLLYTQFRLVH